MSIRPGTLVAVAVASVMFCCAGAYSSASDMFGIGGEGDIDTALVGCGQDTASTPASDNINDGAKVDGFTAEQVNNAATIVSTGQKKNIPPRGWVIAVATAMQESTLHNLDHLGARNDHDSIGLFQQRPSQGWGTHDQIMDPVYAATQFYDHLVKVAGWEKMPLTEAAQRVQRSAYPDAYRDDEPGASRLVDAIAKGAANSGAVAGTCAQPGEVTAGGWVVPLGGGIVSGFRTKERPDHNGVDLAASKRTEIHAAASGTVITSKCQEETRVDAGSCDVDGSPSVRGCGWYVDIKHAEGMITRYCHQIEKPRVNVGDTVTAGQVIGLSGTSGNSSGPHLHFEVHHNNDASKNGAINPVGWMKDHGAALTGTDK